jgi:hypothetical protein
VFDRVPNRVTEALSLVVLPFSCSSPWPAPKIHIDQRQVEKLQRMHRRLLEIGNRRFLLSLAYASISRPLFATTREAMAAVGGLSDQQADRTSLCLQRSLLVAKVSRSFKTHGVIFIGASLHTGDMHAWIIENSEQPDAYDREWVNYRPLLALVGSAF